MNSRYLLICVVLFFCAGLGCSMMTDKPTKVVLKHPQTLDFVECTVDKWEMPNSYKTNEECIEEYEKKGYFIWGKQ